MKKLKIAQIGTSETTHALHIFQTLQKMKNVFDIVGIADVDKHKNGVNPAYSVVPMMSVDELLDYPGLDAVVIECDEELLTEYAIKAAKKKLPIQLEKPGSFSDVQFDSLIDIVEKNNTVFSLNYMYRYNPAVVKAKMLIEEGKIGDIFSVEAQMNCFHNMETRRMYSHMPCGIMYYLGCHTVDLVYQLQGEPLEVLPMSTCVENSDLTDFGMAVFKYNNGVSIAKTCSAEVGGWEHRSLYICGTKGSIEINPLEFGLRGEFNDTCTLKFYSSDTTSVESTTFRYDRYITMLNNFVEMINGKKENPFSYEYERGLHKLLLKACGVKLS